MTFRTVEQYEALVAEQAAKIERLRALVIRAYVEGFGNAWGADHEGFSEGVERDMCWEQSAARAALQPKEAP